MNGTTRKLDRNMCKVNETTHKLEWARPTLTEFGDVQDAQEGVGPNSDFMSSTASSISP